MALVLSAVALVLWLVAFAAFASRNYDTAESPEQSRLYIIVA